MFMLFIELSQPFVPLKIPRRNKRATRFAAPWTLRPHTIQDSLIAATPACAHWFTGKDLQWICLLAAAGVCRRGKETSIKFCSTAVWLTTPCTGLDMLPNSVLQCAPV